MFELTQASFSQKKKLLRPHANCVNKRTLAQVILENQAIPLIQDASNIWKL